MWAVQRGNKIIDFHLPCGYFIVSEKLISDCFLFKNVSLLEVLHLYVYVCQDSFVRAAYEKNGK